MRDQTFDYMKGIGIITMIIGHSIVPLCIDRLIFAWHMPLFFIISGYFYKCVDGNTMFIKNWKGLLIPYLITSFLLVSIGYIKKDEGWNSISSALLSMYVASGSKGNPTVLANYFIGALWFLLALFWCRTLYNLILNKCKTEMACVGGVIVVSSLSIYFGNYILLPMNILQGAGAMIFFLIGHKINTYKLLNFGDSKIIFFFSVLFVFLSAYCGSLSLVRNYYSNFIINFPASILAFISLYKSSVYIVNKNYVFTTLICKIGKISILILCIHILELEFDPIPYYIVNYINIDLLRYIINPFCHVIIVCSIALLIERISIVRYIYNLR